MLCVSQPIDQLAFLKAAFSVVAASPAWPGEDIRQKGGL
jgi:hypothetical protein